MTPPTGTALLAQASAEDLERDADIVLEMFGLAGALGLLSPNRHATLLRLAALARAVAKVQASTDPDIARNLALISTEVPNV